MEIRRLVRVALLTALVAVATLVLRVPMPATEGYINVGDAIIVSGALLFGGVVAGVSGGLGSALADGLGGYAHWAPFTLIIKGVEGLVIGILCQWLKPDLNKQIGLMVAIGSASVGLFCMVTGYFVVELMLYSLGPAMASLPGNFLQAGASLVLGLLLVLALRRSRFDLKRP
jgi:uncharacterized membrane protein